MQCGRVRRSLHYYLDIFCNRLTHLTSQLVPRIFDRVSWFWHETEPKTLICTEVVVEQQLAWRLKLTSVLDRSTRRHHFIFVPSGSRTLFPPVPVSTSPMLPRLSAPSVLPDPFACFCFLRFPSLLSVCLCHLPACNTYLLPAYSPAPCRIPSCLFRLHCCLAFALSLILASSAPAPLCCVTCP
ncbi:hypothetical protein BJV78DRAFT_563073 [Lactifluus subvellereus]|nr:hypothetical protein BJV78DRAFT_563073 [Lactifluus subvellereus]